MASATSASQLTRSLAAFGFPLFVPALQRALGYGWTYSMIAFVDMAIDWFFSATFVCRKGIVDDESLPNF